MTDSAKEVTPFRVFNNGVPIDADFTAQVTKVSGTTLEPNSNGMPTDEEILTAEEGAVEALTEEPVAGKTVAKD